MVLFEDSAAIVGLVIAVAGVALTQATGLVWFDGTASVLIDVILGGAAIWLAYETKGLLIRESANPNVRAGIRQLVDSAVEVLHVNEVLTMHMGPDTILLNLSVKFADDTDAAQIESAVQRIEVKIKNATPEVKRIFIEAEARSTA